MTVWADFLVTAEFAGVPLDVLTARDSLRRSVPSYSFPRRDGAQVIDLGSGPRRTSCQIVFFEREAVDGEPIESGLNHLARFARFWNAANAGRAQEFIHPLTGSYRALVEDIDVTTDAGDLDLIAVDCTFVEDALDPEPFDVGARRPVQAGVGAVEVEAAAVNTELDAVGLESTIADDTLAVVSEWESDVELTARDVTAQLSSLSSDLASAVDDLELATDLERYPLWQAVQRLHFETRRAADAFRQTAPALTEITTTAALPLLVIATNLYGASEAFTRYDEIVALNSVDDPGLVPSGTTLRIAAPDARSRQQLRGAV